MGQDKGNPIPVCLSCLGHSVAIYHGLPLGCAASSFRVKIIWRHQEGSSSVCISISGGQFNRSAAQLGAKLCCWQLPALGELAVLLFSI